MAYGKRRVSSYKRTYTASRKYVPKFKKSYKKPMYKRSGYRKKYSAPKSRSKRR